MKTANIVMFLLLLGIVSANEFYILDSGAIQSDTATRSINVFSALNNPYQLQMFITTALLVILGIILFSYIIHTKLSQHINARFERMRKYAHLIIRVGLGFTLVWGALQGKIFGPELVVLSFFWVPLLFVIGLLLIIGACTRIAAFAALIVFTALTLHNGVYMLTYLFYLAEILVLLLERGELFSVDHYIEWPSHIFHHKIPAFLAELEKTGQEYSFALIRVSFGLALLYTAFSVKVFYAVLSPDISTILFLLFCVTAIEILLSLLITFGVLLRITLSILFFFIIASALYFGETIWPHIMLLTVCIGLFLHGKDQWSLEDKIYGLFWSWTSKFRKDKGLLTPE